MPDPNPNPDPALDPNPDPNPTEPETEETEQQCVGLRQLGWSALLLLALLAVGIWYAHHRINRRTTTAREEKLYRVQNQEAIVDLQGRTTELEQAITKKDTGILAQVDALAAKNREQDQRLDKVETKVGDLGSKLDKSTALLLDAIKGLGGKVDEPSPDEGDTEEPTAEPVATEPEESAAEAAVAPKAAVKTAAKTGRKSAKSPTARARAASGEAGSGSAGEAPAPVVRARSAPAKPGPADEDELLAGARKEHSRIKRSLAAARAAHEAHRIAGEQVEALVEEVVGGEESLTSEDAAAVERHRRLYQPAAIRPTAWRDVRTDETKVVFAGRR